MLRTSLLGETGLGPHTPSTCAERCNDYCYCHYYDKKVLQIQTRQHALDDKQKQLEVVKLLSWFFKDGFSAIDCWVSGLSGHVTVCLTDIAATISSCKKINAAAQACTMPLGTWPDMIWAPLTSSICAEAIRHYGSVLSGQASDICLSK